MELKTTMDFRIRIALVCLVFLIAGCPAGNGSSVNIEMVGSLNASDEGFRFDGAIVNGGFDSDAEFESVTLYLFKENGSVIDSHHIERLDGRVAVTMTAEEIPEYVIVSSKSFWKQDEPEVEYYRLDDERMTYVSHLATGKGNLPVTPAD